MSAAPGLTRVELTAKYGPDAALKVGGHLLPFESCTLTIDATADRLEPHLTVALPVFDGLLVTLDRAHVTLAGPTREALISLGWAPPDALTELADLVAEGKMSVNAARKALGLPTWPVPECDEAREVP